MPLPCGKSKALQTAGSRAFLSARHFLVAKLLAAHKAFVHNAPIGGAFTVKAFAS